MIPEPSPASGPAALPFHVVTGFLGAGKTTAINRLLGDATLADALVVVNEWGEIGLDHLLYEKLAGDAILIASGCVCCALRGDLVDCLQGLLTRRERGDLPRFSRLVLETTGLAEPAPILTAIFADPLLSRRLALAGVTTLVDAVNGLATLAARPEAARQIALADRIALAKSDLLPAEARRERLTALRRAIAALNPGAPVHDLAAGEFSAAEFLAPAAALNFAPVETGAGHTASVRTHAFRAAAPLEPRRFERFAALLGERLGPRLLRLKGLVALADRPDAPLLVQGAQHVLHAPVALSAWPDADHTTRIVLIVDGVPARAVEHLWAALTGTPLVDAPDLAALADNPLAPRGGGLFG